MHFFDISIQSTSVALFYFTKICLSVICDTLKSSDKSKSRVEFKVVNHIIRDTDEIANHFNDYFINISRTLLQQIQPTHSFDHYLHKNAASRLQFHSVSKEYISKLIDKLKNKLVLGMTIYQIN